jgi:uncharacterized protein (UPF0332 family)
MRNFLPTLQKEGKLAKVGPSANLFEAYAKKSQSNLSAARLLLEHGQNEEAVSLAYYSMYHMLTSLLFRAGIKCENHSAAILLLHEVFGKDNSAILNAKKERVDKQYFTSVEVSEGDVSSLVSTAAEFNAGIYDFASRLDSDSIAGYRKKLDSILGRKTGAKAEKKR